MDNVHIHNVVSARGDTFAVQFFPSNDVTIGPNIQIEDIHAGAALSKSVLGSLTNSMPNKIPRACAVTMWTWTDEEQEFYENQIRFEDKEAVHAKCLTTHTACSDSDFDGELLDSILSCDGSTIVKGDGHLMDNMLLYDTFIRHQSPTHRKLADIIRGHKAPDFFPPRAFPGHWANLPLLERFAIPLMMATAAMLMSALYAMWNWRRSQLIHQYAPIGDYKPLAKAK